MQVAALSQMLLQAMESVVTQEKELSALLVEFQVILKSSLERPHQKTTQVLPEDINWLRCEAFDYLPVQLTSIEGQHQKQAKSLT